MLISFYSGTTWVQEIIWQMYNEGAINSEHILKRVPFLETATSGMLPDPKTLPSPRLLKSHLSYNNTPKSGSKDKQCKYIYIARNPKDVAVSFFHFTKTLSKNPLHGYNGPWEFFLKLFMEGNGKVVCAWISRNEWNEVRSQLKQLLFSLKQNKKISRPQYNVIRCWYQYQY